MWAMLTSERLDEIRRAVDELARAKEAATEGTPLEAMAAELLGEVGRLQAQEVSVNTWGLQLIDALGRFLQQTLAAGHPMTTQICIDFPDCEGAPVVHLWASVDDLSPVARCRELAAQAAQARRQAFEEAARLLDIMGRTGHDIFEAAAELWKRATLETTP
jgi:hypothetical protein